MMPESLRKKRQRARRAPEDVLLDAIRSFLSTKGEFTVEINPVPKTFGFNVRGSARLTDREVVELGNELLDVASASWPASGSTWTWMIGIYREDELADVIHPEDDPRLICSVCGSTQQRSLGERCLACRSEISL